MIGPCSSKLSPDGKHLEVVTSEGTGKDRHEVGRCKWCSLERVYPPTTEYDWARMLEVAKIDKASPYIIAKAKPVEVYMTWK